MGRDRPTIPSAPNQKAVGSIEESSLEKLVKKTRRVTLIFHTHFLTYIPNKISPCPLTKGKNNMGNSFENLVETS
jgi:hypothetical protein